MAGFRGCPDASAIVLYKLIRDGEAKAGSVMLCSEEGIENSIQLFWTDARTGILD